MSQIEEVSTILLPRLQEQFGAKGLEQVVLVQWLWGLLTHSVQLL